MTVRKLAVCLSVALAMVVGFGIGPASAANGSKDLYVAGILKATAYHTDSTDTMCVRALNSQTGARATAEIVDASLQVPLDYVSDGGGDNEQHCTSTPGYAIDGIAVYLYVCFISAAGKSTCASSPVFAG